jgi:hypothetical protein
LKSASSAAAAAESRTIAPGAEIALGSLATPTAEPKGTLDVVKLKRCTKMVNQHLLGSLGGAHDAVFRATHDRIVAGAITVPEFVESVRAVIGQTKNAEYAAQTKLIERKLEGLLLLQVSQNEMGSMSMTSTPAQSPTAIAAASVISSAPPTGVVSTSAVATPPALAPLAPTN